MLIHCHYNSDYSGHVTLNYRDMVERLSEIPYHTACALLNYGNYQLLFKHHKMNMFTGYRREQFIWKAYRIQSGNLSPLLVKYLRGSGIAPELLKLMIQEKAEDLRVMVFWQLEQIAGQWYDASSLGYVAPLAMLKRLVWGPEIFIEDTQGMLGVVTMLVWQKKVVPKEAHVLYVLMF